MRNKMDHMSIYGLVLLVLGCCQADNPVVHSERLMDDLWQKSSAARRYTPPFNDNGTVEVQYGISLVRVQAVDLETNVVDLLCWDKLAWNDERLRWDPMMYGGIDALRIPCDMIWTPDIMPFFSSVPDEIKTRAEVLAVVEHTGDVLYIPPNTKRIQCDNSEANQTLACSMKYGSWTYSSEQIDLQFYGEAVLDVGNFRPSGSVKGVGSNEAQRNLKTYPCCPELYVDLTFDFELELN